MKNTNAKDDSNNNLNLQDHRDKRTTISNQIRFESVKELDNFLLELQGRYNL